MLARRSPDAGPVAIWVTRVGEATSAAPSADAVRDLAATMLARMAHEIAGVRARLVRDPDGRPRLAGCPAPPHVSISHDRDHLAVGLAHAGPIGVDLEAVRDLPAVALARRWFDREEAAWLERQPAERQAELFLQLWTRKEAVGKALGLGLRGGGMRRLVGRPRVERADVAALPPATEPTSVAALPPATEPTSVAALPPATESHGVAVTDVVRRPLIVAVACAHACAAGARVEIRWDVPTG